MTTTYIHGYDEFEQERLVNQASYWMDLILSDLTFRPGEHVLEIGCRVGAVLGVLGDAFPEVRFSGVDISEQQIAYAIRHLSSVKSKEYELKVGDAKKLPWDNDSFDHVFIMWVVEHIKDPTDVFMEANRVLKTGGSITIIETDYSSIQVYPPNLSFRVLMSAFIEYFNINGDAFTGRKLGRDLDKAEIIEVSNKLLGLNFWNQRDNAEIHRHTHTLYRGVC